jgi:hypothetical protein
MWLLNTVDQPHCTIYNWLGGGDLRHRVKPVSVRRTQPCPGAGPEQFKPDIPPPRTAILEIYAPLSVPTFPRLLGRACPGGPQRIRMSENR